MRVHTTTKILAVSVTMWSVYILTQISWNSGIFYGDALGYHAYLPAVFIHDQLWSPELMALDTTIESGIRTGIEGWRGEYPQNARGHVVLQYTSGIAIMNAPFFLTAHVLARLTGYEFLNGFSMPYLWAIKAATLTYALLGMYLLFYLLKQRFGSDASLFTLILLAGGTNLFYFALIQTGMAHVHLFFLYILLLHFSLEFWEKKSIKLLAIVAVLLGLITLIRPTDLLAGLIPLLIGIDGRKSFAERFTYVYRNKGRFITVGLLLFALPIVPQLFYWKKMTGSWIFDSYPGQHFDFLHPHLLEGLFGGFNGWFTYTPLMMVPFVLVWFKKFSVDLTAVNRLLIPIYVVIVYSWWNYFYINGFGSRPMVHIYGLLAFPLAALVSNSGRYSMVIKMVLIMLAGVNVVYTHKVLKGDLYTDQSTHAFNFHTFFKQDLNYADIVLLETDCLPAPMEHNTLLSEWVAAVDTMHKANNSDAPYFVLGPDQEYTPFTVEYMLTPEDLSRGRSLIFSGEFLAPELVYYTYYQPQMVAVAERGGQSVLWKSVRINNKIGKVGEKDGIQIKTCAVVEWGAVFFTIPLQRLTAGDKIRLLVWNPEKTHLWIRKLQISMTNEPTRCYDE